MKSTSLHLRRICGCLKIVSFLHHCNVSKWTFIQTLWTSADNVHQSSTSGHSHTTDQADTCRERRAGGPHVFKGHQRAPADKARVKCLCGVVTSALSIVFALGQQPPLDDSGSSFTDLRVVYHLIIIALSHYFLCCILWALSLNQALNHYYILFSLSHIIFAVQPNSYQPCGTHKSFYQINEQKRNILLLLLFFVVQKLSNYYCVFINTHTLCLKRKQITNHFCILLKFWSISAVILNAIVNSTITILWAVWAGPTWVPSQCDGQTRALGILPIH